MSKQKSQYEDLKRILKELKAHSEEVELVNTRIESGSLNGYVKKDDIEGPVHFRMEYDRDNFLRVGVESGDYKDKISALSSLGEMLSEIDDNGKLGMPIAFYNICEVNNTKPHLEWAFSKKEDYIKDLKYDTLFDDKDIAHLVLLKKNTIPLPKKMKKIGSLMALKCIRK